MTASRWRIAGIVAALAGLAMLAACSGETKSSGAGAATTDNGAPATPDRRDLPADRAALKPIPADHGTPAGVVHSFLRATQARNVLTMMDAFDPEELARDAELSGMTVEKFKEFLSDYQWKYYDVDTTYEVRAFQLLSVDEFKPGLAEVRMLVDKTVQGLTSNGSNLFLCVLRNGAWYIDRSCLQRQE